MFKFIAIPNTLSTLSSSLRYGLALLIPLLVACGDGNQESVPSAPTAVPSPTAIVIPTSVPTPVVVSRGIGVSRSDFSPFVSMDVWSFTAEDSPLRDGRERLILTSPDDNTMVELIGPSDDLTEATIIIWDPQNSISALYMIGFISVAVPGWAEGSTWLTDNVGKLLADPSTSIHAQYENVKIQYSYTEVLGTLSVTVNSK